MNFSEIVLGHLRSLFVKYDLKIKEQRIDFLQLVSGRIIITIGHNQLENSNSVFISKKESEKESIDIDNQVLLEFFHSDLKLAEVPAETFVENLVTFFKNDGQPLLMGDEKMIADLENFDEDRSRKYTQELMKRQNLAVANKAWNEQNYIEFIKIIDEINDIRLPSSYQLKYEIAKKKI